MEVKVAVLSVLLIVSWVGPCQAGSWGRIVGGSNAAAREFPFICSIWVRLNSGLTRDRQMPWSTCSIINNRAVLTTASSIQAIQASNMSFVVIAGVTNLNDFRLGVSREVSAIRIHSGYDAFTLNNDAAILKMSLPLPTSTRIQYALLPSSRCNYLPTNSVVFAAGWGMTHQNSNQYWTNRLQKVQLRIKNRAQCNDAYFNSLTANMTCAGYPNRGLCMGDSGAPMVRKLRGRWQLDGIASQSAGCADNNYPTVFTDTCKIRPWIIRNW